VLFVRVCVWMRFACVRVIGVLVRARVYVCACVCFACVCGVWCVVCVVCAVCVVCVRVVSV
jgi:hypothetical protein